jgi:hypothetical protein
MKNGEKEGFDVNDVSAYLELIQSWRDSLHDIATGALQMQGIEESERDNLKRALNSLYSIDELVKIIGEHPYTHVQAHGFHNLWSIIGAAFIIGSRGIENPLTQKILKDERAKSTARARSGKPSTRHRDQINEVVGRHSADHTNPRRQNANAKATDILEAVNSDLAKLGITLTHESLRKKISSLKLAG